MNKRLWLLKINVALKSSPIKSIYEAVTIANMNKYVRILMKFLPKISSWRQRKNFCARMANIGIWTRFKTQKYQKHWLANFVVDLIWLNNDYFVPQEALKKASSVGQSKFALMEKYPEQIS